MITDELIAAFDPWITPDLEVYLTAIAGMAEQVEWYIGGDDYEPYELLLDPDLTRLEALPYLAQYVGERLPKGLTEQQQRDWIKDAPNQRRGTVGAIVAAAQRSLTGSRLVQVILRSDGTPGDHPDDIVVLTYTSQTPSADLVLRDLADVVPLDIGLNYQRVAAPTWQQISVNYTDWADVSASFATWGELAAAMAGGVVYGR